MIKNRLLALGLLVVFLFGCQPLPTTYYRGASAVDMDVVSLLTGQHEKQRWQDLYITVDYTLEQTGEVVDIEGVLTLSQHPRGMYTHVPDLKLKLFFLDKDLRVINYLDVARTLSASLEDETRFKKTLQVDSQAVAFTFGYEGRLYDSDPERPSSDIIWKLPKRNG